MVLPLWPGSLASRLVLLASFGITYADDVGYLACAVAIGC
jgi:hypothetical protein